MELYGLLITALERSWIGSLLNAYILGQGVFLIFFIPTMVPLYPGECFTKTEIDLKSDLTMAGCSCHCLLSSLRSLDIISFNNENVDL